MFTFIQLVVLKCFILTQYIQSHKMYMDIAFNIYIISMPPPYIDEESIYMKMYVLVVHIV